MKIKMWKAGLIALVLFLVSLKACSFGNGPIDGQVVDATTGKPIANAIVTVLWIGDFTKLADSSTSCYHAESARTDENGKYHIAAWSRPWSSSALLLTDTYFLFRVFYPSYLDRPGGEATRDPQDIKVISLSPFKGSEEEYLEARWHHLSDCHTNPAALPVWSAIYKEVSKMKETPEQQRVLEWLDEVIRESTQNIKNEGSVR